MHRAGGMLLQLAKELVICGDFTENDVFFYYTTTGKSDQEHWSCTATLNRIGVLSRLDDVELSGIWPLHRNDLGFIRRKPAKGPFLAVEAH